MPTKRLVAAAAVNRNGVSAGTIASSSGKANVTPAPRRNVRRGMYFLVRITSALLVRTCCVLVGLGSHLKLRAADDAHHQRREPIVILRGVAHDRANRRHVR